MNEVSDFGKAWERRHPEAGSYEINLFLNEEAVSEEQVQHTAPSKREVRGIDKEFWIRDIGRRMISAVRLSKNKPIGEIIMADYNSLNPEEQNQVQQFIKEQGVR